MDDEVNEISSDNENEEDESKNIINKSLLIEVPNATTQPKKIMVVGPIFDVNSIKNIITTETDTLPGMSGSSQIICDKNGTNTTNLRNSPAGSQKKIVKNIHNVADAVIMKSFSNPAIGNNNVMAVSPKEQDKMMCTQTNTNSRKRVFHDSAVINLVGESGYESPVIKVSKNGFGSNSMTMYSQWNRTEETTFRDRSTQTKGASSITMLRKLKILNQKIRRRSVALTQLRTVLKLIKKCKNFSQLQQVLSTKLTPDPK